MTSAPGSRAGTRPRISTEELVRVTIVQNELEAEIVLALLETEGIQSMQRYTDVAAGGLDGSLGSGGAREIVVRAADLERARELLQAQ